MIKLKIDLLKFTGAREFTSKEGVDFIAIPIKENHIFIGKKARYLDAVLFDNRNGTDEYGNDGFVSIDLPKAARDAGQKGPILGNWKHLGKSEPQRESGPSARSNSQPAEDDNPW